MNRSKILGASALASLMTAGVAQAEMSVSGYLLGAFADSDGGGVTNYHTSETVTVSYSDTLDNGMGISVGMDITDTLGTLVTIDTGMGSINFSGDGRGDSALDKVDTSTACFGLFWCSNAYSTVAGGGTYDDGDTHSGNSIRYVSPSINGFTIQASHGLESSGDYLGTDSVGVTGSIMGVTVKAGFADINFDQGGGSTEVDKTPSMYALGYSLAGLDLGYAFYDSDDTASSEETQYGVGTSVMGMYVGAQFGAHDTTGNDTDYMTLSAIKSMGAASFSYEYIEVDEAGGTANDSDTHLVAYSIGF
ncbi:porin [Pelagibacteraceae bacterium]|nr:porin [Pelagibacteraceae bacterium]